MIYETSKRFIPIYKQEPIPPTPPGPDYSTMPLTLENIGSVSTNIQFQKQGAPAANLSYKIDDGEWTSFPLGTENISNSIVLPAGSKVAFSGSNSVWGTYWMNWRRIQAPYTANGVAIKAYGNVNSLINFNETVPNCCFVNLMSGFTKLVDVQNLVLTGIMQDYCYANMFQNCSGLSTVPVNLLPATALATGCYRYMFQNCSNLKNAPYLPATNVAKGCYQGMFQGCTSLTEMKVNFTDWGTDNTQYTNNWVNGVAANGTFKCPHSLPDQRGTSNIPNNWTRVQK